MTEWACRGGVARGLGGGREVRLGVRAFGGGVGRAGTREALCNEEKESARANRGSLAELTWALCSIGRTTRHSSYRTLCPLDFLISWHRRLKLKATPSFSGLEKLKDLAEVLCRAFERRR